MDGVSIVFLQIFIVGYKFKPGISRDGGDGGMHEGTYCWRELYNGNLLKDGQRAGKKTEDEDGK